MAKASKTKAPIDGAEGNSEPSGLAGAPASDAPSSGAATGTNSTDDPPEQQTDGGAGNAAGSAGSGEFDVDALFDQLQPVADRPTAEAEFRAQFPHFSAALDAWKEEHGDQVCSGLRIRAKKDGFRRAGIAHSKAPVEHRGEAFRTTEQIESLFAEPNLVVELI